MGKPLGKINPAPNSLVGKAHGLSVPSSTPSCPRPGARQHPAEQGGADGQLETPFLLPSPCPGCHQSTLWDMGVWHLS